MRPWERTAILGVAFERAGGRVKGLLIIWMGCHALMGQVILIREFLVISYGHELCMGVVFASWLGGVFAGNWLGSRLQGKGGRASGRFVAWQSACVLLAPGSVMAIRLVRSVIHSGPGVPLPLAPTMACALGLVFPLGMTVGVLFPLACSMMESPSGQPSKVIAKAYVLEATGMLLGGVSLTFLLLPRMDHLAILAAVGSITLITATLITMGEVSKGWSGALVCLSLSWTLCWALGGFGHLQEVSAEARWRALHPGLQRLCTKESLYQSVELGNLNGQFSVFGNGQLLSSFPDPHGVAFPVHLLMNQEPGPERVLIVGGGPGSLLPLLLDYPVREVHLVDLDPLVFRIASPYLPPDIQEALRDPRVRLTFHDARHWVRNFPSGSLDAVLLQVPDPSTALLNRFHTVEFFRDLGRAMRPDAFLMTSVTGSMHYFGEEMVGYLGTLHRTLQEVFQEVALVPGERSTLLASPLPGVVSLDPEVLGARMEARRIRDPHFPPEAFSFWIQENQIQLWRRALEDHRGPLNKDTHPVSYLHYLMLWELVSGEKWGWSLLGRIKGLGFGWLLLLLAGVIMSYLLPVREGRRRRSRLTIIALTGFTGMAQEILGLYMYQAVQGYLYSRLGIIVALFMAGLAAGGWLGSRFSSSGLKEASLALIWDQGFLLLLCLGVPLGWIPLFFDTPGPSWGDWTVGVALGTWMFLAGAGTGAAFPLVCATLGQGSVTPGRVAGQAGAADHLGAALGALLPATVLAPLLGLAQAGFFLAAMQTASLVLVLLDLLDHRGGVR